MKFYTPRTSEHPEEREYKHLKQSSHETLIHQTLIKARIYAISNSTQRSDHRLNVKSESRLTYALI